jgi:hypothetical protein
LKTAGGSISSVLSSVPAAVARSDSLVLSGMLAVRLHSSVLSCSAAAPEVWCSLCGWLWLLRFNGAFSLGGCSHATVLFNRVGCSHRTVLSFRLGCSVLLVLS